MAKSEDEACSHVCIDYMVKAPPSSSVRLVDCLVESAAGTTIVEVSCPVALRMRISYVSNTAQ